MNEILIVVIITFLASMSPGPDFILVVKNNILYSLRNGIFTSIGVWVWVLVHVAYCIAWVWILISQSILLFNIIKVLGALYLLYLAYLLLTAKKQDKNISVDKNQKGKEKTAYWFFLEGFLTNVLNPKATIFFLSVFTQVLEPWLSIGFQFILGLTMMWVVTIWFILLSVFLNNKYIKSSLHWFQYWVEKVMWTILAFLWIKVLLSSAH